MLYIGEKVSCFVDMTRGGEPARSVSLVLPCC